MHVQVENVNIQQNEQPLGVCCKWTLNEVSQSVMSSGAGSFSWLSMWKDKRSSELNEAGHRSQSVVSSGAGSFSWLSM